MNVKLNVAYMDILWSLRLYSKKVFFLNAQHSGCKHKQINIYLAVK